MTQLLPPKKEVALALLERSNVDVYLDPRAKGVVVPPQFRKEPRLILKIGLNMPVPIPDLRVDEESMSCTLSFNRSPFYCVVPWSSVFAMVGEDGRGMVWPDDVPQELAVKVVEPGQEAPQGPRAVPREIGPSASSASSASGASGASGASASSGGGRRNGRAAKLTDESASASAASPASPASRAGAGAAPSSRGGKRGKKKKEEGTRPVLVSVPPPPASSPELGAEASSSSSSSSSSSGPSSAGAEAARSPRAGQAGQPPQQSGPAARPRDGVSPIPSARPRQPPSALRRPPPNDGQARPKRELPPYLRVVK